MINLALILSQLCIGLLIVRFHINLYSHSHNPVAIKLNRVTHSLVHPFTFKRIRRRTRYDFPALIAALIIALLVGYLFQPLMLKPPMPRQLSYSIILGINLIFLSTWLNVILYAMILVVIGSWLQTDPRQPVIQIALSCCNMLLKPIQKFVPSFRGIDFSPLIALLILNTTRRALELLSSKMILLVS